MKAIVKKIKFVGGAMWTSKMHTRKKLKDKFSTTQGEFCEIRTNGIEGIEEGGPNSFLEEDFLNSCSRVLIEHTFLQITPVQLLPSANALF